MSKGGEKMSCREEVHCCNRKYHDPLYCLCHQRKGGHHCNKEIHCKVDKKLEKDCLKIDWLVPEGATQSIFQTNGFNQLIGSGFISYDKGHSPFIIVRFYLQGIQQGSNIQVFEDSSVAFTYTKFDQITVSCPASVEVEPGAENNTQIPACFGELNIFSKYSIY